MKNKQIYLEELLVKKGIGPNGSKHFTSEQCLELEKLLLDHSLSLVSQASLLASLLILDQNDFEKNLIIYLKKERSSLQKELHFLLTMEADSPFESLLLEVLQKKDLNTEKATSAMDFFFSKNTPHYLKAIFLQLERLKRETFTENLSFFTSFYKETERIQTELPELLDFCSPYDGWKRKPNYGFYLSRLFAAVGVPSLLHGTLSVGPKYGWTHEQLLKHYGHSVDFEQLDNSFPWAYSSQKKHLSSLNDLLDMRKEMVKRTFLATYEKHLQPLRAKEGNTLISGYTHKHYKLELAEIFKAHGAAKRALILKGDEGSHQLALNKVSNYTYLSPEGDIYEGEISPLDFGFDLQENPGIKSTLTALVKSIENPSEEERNYVENLLLYNALALNKLLGLGISSSKFQSALSQISMHKPS